MLALVGAHFDEWKVPCSAWQLSFVHAHCWSPNVAQKLQLKAKGEKGRKNGDCYTSRSHFP